MSDVIPHKNRIRQERLRSFSKRPTELRFSPYTPAKISFSDDSIGQATCLGCQDTPCIELPNSAFTLQGQLASFPGDPSRDVCPTDAINWNIDSESPDIAQDKCIGCGLCAAFCPYGAISINAETNKAIIESKDPDLITQKIKNYTSNSIDLNYMKDIRKGSLANTDHLFISSLPDIKSYLTELQSKRLIRNMLIACKIRTSVRRKGDTNIRIDGIANFFNKKTGIIEIELSSSVLESPRALLEDIAIIHNRYKIEIKNIIPISIILSYPNKRAEYYQVIKDIENILNIRIQTISLGLLCMTALTSETINELLITPEVKFKNSFAMKLVKQIPKNQLKEPYLGALLPPK